MLLLFTSVIVSYLYIVDHCSVIDYVMTIGDQLINPRSCSNREMCVCADYTDHDLDYRESVC